jgi:phosphoglycolate phosphatase
VVVGDTPHDVVAAHAIGAVCIAVCTGWYDADALRAVGAHLVADDLRVPRVLEEITTDA